MKYLKYIYESESVINQDIHDILLEINDIGFESHIGKYFSSTNYILIKGYVCIYTSSTNDWVGSTHKELRRQKIINDGIKRDEINNIVKDCLLRIKEYLGDRYDTCQILYKGVLFGHNGWEILKIEEDMKLGDIISEIEIYFR